jgi:cation transporter-like permease
VVPALDPDGANAVPGRYAQVTSWGESSGHWVGHGPDHEQAKEAAMSVVSFALALPVVLLFVAMLAYLLARAFLLVGPPGAYRHRPPRGRHP